MPETNQLASNLIVPGVYVKIQQPTQAVAPFVNTSVNAFVGVANYGPVNKPVVCGGPQDILGQFGNDSIGAATASSIAYQFSLIEEMLMALTEDGSAIGVRVTDGTDLAAAIAVLDTAGSPGTILTLTAKYTGSLPNGYTANGSVAPGTAAATARVDLVSSSNGLETGNNPVFRLTIFNPGINAAPEVYNNIIGYATIGAAYDGPTFKANALAAINGTAPNTVGSLNWTASTGSSTVKPLLATAFAAAGGADGSSTVSPTIMLGSTDSGTGMNALDGTPFFQLVLCGLGGGNVSNLAFVPTISAFVAAQGAALGIFTVPKGTTDSAAFAARLANGATANNMVLVKDYLYVFDTLQGVFRYVSPMGKAAGILGMLPASSSPINQPFNTTGLTAAYVVATEQSQLGVRTQDALAAMISNGFCSITNQMPLNNGAFGFFDDITAAGAPQGLGNTGNYIPVVRMNAYLGQAFLQLGGQFVGQNQSVQANDPLRATVEAVFNNFLSSLKPNGGPAQIDEFSVTCDLTNNNPTSISQGYCYVTVLVRFLGVVRIFYVTVQGGTGVTVSNTPPPTA